MSDRQAFVFVLIVALVAGVTMYAMFRDLQGIKHDLSFDADEGKPKP